MHDPRNALRARTSSDRRIWLTRALDRRAQVALQMLRRLLPRPSAHRGLALVQCASASSHAERAMAPFLGKRAAAFAYYLMSFLAFPGQQALWTRAIASAAAHPDGSLPSTSLPSDEVQRGSSSFCVRPAVPATPAHRLPDAGGRKPTAAAKPTGRLHSAEQCQPAEQGGQVVGGGEPGSVFSVCTSMEADSECETACGSSSEGP